MVRSLQSRPRRFIRAGIIAISAFAGSLLVASWHPASAQAPALDPVWLRWGVPAYFSIAEPVARKPTWGRRLTGYLNTRDGVRLRFSALLPKGRGPFPVIVNYSGYDPGSIGGDAYLHDDTTMSANLDRSLLEHGYAVLGVNARGTGCSEGQFEFLTRAYGTDGADIIEWAAAQRWSTGAVGMANWSWAGMSQLATAAERPAHLKAIAPGMALTDARSDSWAIGGVPSQGFITGWWQFLHSRWLAARHSAEVEGDTGCLAQVELNYKASEEPDHNLPTQLIRHPMRDAWIDDRSLLGRMDRIEVPVLSMEAFQDEATTARAGYYHDRLAPGRLWLIQTNGNHDLYESLEFRSTLIAFFDHFVKGLKNGFESRPHVEVWQDTDAQGVGSHAQDESAAPRWRITRDQYPVVTGEWRLRLGANQSLVDDASAPAVAAQAEGSDAYTYPVAGPIVNVKPGRGEWGDLPPSWRAGSVAYTSGALDRDVVIYGPASADLWVSTSASDTDLQVTLTELRPDGQERFLQRGWLRLSDRAIDPAWSTPTRPILCDRPQCIAAPVPDRPVLARVELTKLAHAFHAGSHVRLWIDAPSATGENDFDHSSIPSTNRVWHDREHPSQIVFGTLSGIEVPTEEAGCGHVLMEPCRADPLAR